MLCVAGETTMPIKIGIAYQVFAAMQRYEDVRL
jgi:hypothetical protein